MIHTHPLREVTALVICTLAILGLPPQARAAKRGRPRHAVGAANPPGGTTVELSPYFATTSILAKDLQRGGSFNLSSLLYAGLGIDVGFAITDFLQAFTEIKAAYVSFAPLANSSKTLANSSTFLNSYHFGTALQILPNLYCDLLGGADKLIFLSSPTTLTATAESVLVPTLGSQITWKLSGSGKFGVKLTATGLMHLAATTDNYTINTGYSYGGGIGITKLSGKGEAFALIVGALFRDQDTSITNQKDTTFSLTAQIIL